MQGDWRNLGPQRCKIESSGFAPGSWMFIITFIKQVFNFFKKNVGRQCWCFSASHPLFLGHKVRVATAFCLGGIWVCFHSHLLLGEVHTAKPILFVTWKSGKKFTGSWVYSFPVQSAEIYSSSTWGRTVTISPTPLLLCCPAWSWMTPSRSVSCHLWYSHWVGITKSLIWPTHQARRSL